jgi:hypothetical protein
MRFAVRASADDAELTDAGFFVCAETSDDTSSSAATTLMAKDSSSADAGFVQKKIPQPKLRDWQNKNRY